MSSSNKTPHFLLNRWSGGDKPKKDDFNYDNVQVDEALQALSQAVERHEVALGQTMSAPVRAHIEDAGIHVTAAERAQWNAGAAVTGGSYTGNDASARKIVLGFRPSFGIVFEEGGDPSRANFATNNYALRFAFFGSLGCSGGVVLDAEGFTVSHVSGSTPDGFAYKLNAAGARYAYIVWR